MFAKLMMLFALVVAALSMPTPDDDYYRYGSVYGGRVSYVPVQYSAQQFVVPSYGINFDSFEIDHDFD